MNSNLFRNFIEKSRTFDGNFPVVLSKLLSICRVTIWGRTIFASWILSGNSSGHWVTIFQGFAENISYGCTNCFLRVQRIDVCVQYLRRSSFFWNSCIFSSTVGLREKPHQLSSRSFWQSCQSSILGVQRENVGVKSFKKNIFNKKFFHSLNIKYPVVYQKISAAYS